jgi:hypothetical protein
VEAEQTEGEEQKIEDVPSDLLFFDEDPEGVKEKRNNNEHVLNGMEPDDRREEKAKTQQLEFGERFLKTEKTKDRQGEKRHDDLGIDVERVEEHRGGKAKEKPKAEGKALLLPLLQGKKKDLNSKESTEHTHPASDDKEHRRPAEQRTKRIKREKKYGKPGRMEGIFASGAGSDVGSYLNLWRHDLGVIPVGVVVGKVKITVCEHTVGDEKIVGLIPGEVYAFFDEDGRACAVKKKRHNKKENEFRSE